MPRYEYRCPTCGDTKTIIQPMSSDLPPDVPCGIRGCLDRGQRVFEPPAAILFKGPGFYSTDVKGRVGRRRRPNPGDSLHKDFDHAAAKIADAI